MAQVCIDVLICFYLSGRKEIRGWSRMRAIPKKAETSKNKKPEMSKTEERRSNCNECQCRVVSRFLSRRFHPKSRRLFPFYFSNITLRTDLLTFRVTGAVFKIASEMRWLPAYFDNPVNVVFS